MTAFDTGNRIIRLEEFIITGYTEGGGTSYFVGRTREPIWAGTWWVDGVGVSIDGNKVFNAIYDDVDVKYNETHSKSVYGVQFNIFTNEFVGNESVKDYGLTYRGGLLYFTRLYGRSIEPEDYITDDVVLGFTNENGSYTDAIVSPNVSQVLKTTHSIEQFVLNEGGISSLGKGHIVGMTVAQGGLVTPYDQFRANPQLHNVEGRVLSGQYVSLGRIGGTELREITLLDNSQYNLARYGAVQFKMKGGELVFPHKLNWINSTTFVQGNTPNLVQGSPQPVLRGFQEVCTDRVSSTCIPHSSGMSTSLYSNYSLRGFTPLYEYGLATLFFPFNTDFESTNKWSSIPASLIEDRGGNVLYLPTTAYTNTSFQSQNGRMLTSPYVGKKGVLDLRPLSSSPLYVGDKGVTIGGWMANISPYSSPYISDGPRDVTPSHAVVRCGNICSGSTQFPPIRYTTLTAYSQNISSGDWHHVVLSVDFNSTVGTPTKPIAAYYVDGVLQQGFRASCGANDLGAWPNPNLNCSINGSNWQGNIGSQILQVGAVDDLLLAGGKYDNIVYYKEGLSQEDAYDLYLNDGAPVSKSMRGVQKSVADYSYLIVDVVGELVNNSNSASGSSAAVSVLGINDDSAADIIYLTETSIRMLISAPATSRIANELVMSSALCSVNPGGKITAYGAGVLAQNPNAVRFNFELNEFNTTVALATHVSTLPTSYGVSDRHTFTVSLPGKYDVTIAATDTFTGESVEKMCTITIGSIQPDPNPDPDSIEDPIGPINPPNATECTANAQCVPSGGVPECYSCVANYCVIKSTGLCSQVAPPEPGCTLYPDGEFNFGGPLSSYGWTTVGTSPELTGTAAWFRSKTEGTLTHGLNCYSPTLLLDWGVVTASQGDITLRVGAAGVDIAGVQIRNGALVSLSGVQLGSISNGNHTISLYMDASLSTYAVMVDGTTLTTLPFQAAKLGPYSYVKLKASDCGASVCSVVVDFVRFGTLASGDSTVLVGSNSSTMLGSCVTNSSSRTYRVVDRYCTDKFGESRLCTMDDLGTIIKLDGRCYKEAMNYCVYKMYPTENGLIYTAEQEQGTMVGAATCGLGLPVQVVTKKVIVPTFNVVWNQIILQNILLSLVVLTIIVVAIVQQRRR